MNGLRFMSDIRLIHIQDYLAHFDALAGVLPLPRRRALRAEIEQHLLDALTPNSSEADATLAILEFGSPEEIIEQELEAHQRTDGTTLTRRTARVTVAALALIVIGALATGIFALTGSPSRASNAGPHYGSSVVAIPKGPERTSKGRAFGEYTLTIETLPELPADAEWPTGIPVGLDAGATSDGGLMQAGGGAVIAQFTWLCAWEEEMLAAHQADDGQAVAVAAAAIEDWLTTDFALIWSPDGGWRHNVFAPTEFDDFTAMKRDYIGICNQAGIYNASS